MHPFMTILCCANVQLKDQKWSMNTLEDTLNNITRDLGQHNFVDIEPADPMQVEFSQVTKGLNHLLIAIGRFATKSRSIYIILREIHKTLTSEANAGKMLEWTENMQLETEMNEITLENMYKQSEAMLTVVSPLYLVRTKEILIQAIRYSNSCLKKIQKSISSLRKPLQLWQKPAKKTQLS